MSVDPDDPLDFTPTADGDDIIDKLRDVVKESYDNGYRDGSIDQRVWHSDRCPNADGPHTWWRDRHDAIFPPYPPFILMVAATALVLADDGSATTAFFVVTAMWSVLALLVRAGLLLALHWNAHRNFDDEKDH